MESLKLIETFKDTLNQETGQEHFISCTGFSFSVLHVATPTKVVHPKMRQPHSAMGSSKVLIKCGSQQATSLAAGERKRTIRMASRQNLK